RAQRGRRTRLHARRTVRATQAELIQEVEFREERLVGDDVREAPLRIDDALELRAEGAVLVRARSDREEHAIAERCLLLDVVAERFVGARQRAAGALHRALSG